MTRDRAAVVTGAGGAMGRAIALALAARGLPLVLADVSATRLEATASALAAAGGEHTSVRADVTSRAGADEVQAAAQAAGWHVGVLINVVGGYRGPLYESVLEISEERFDEVWRLNLKGSLLLTQRFAPGMLERGWGRIVNISSVAKDGASGQADYAAAKAAVVAFSRSCALELAPAITVNAVAPGLIRTTVLDRLDDAAVDRYRARIPGGEAGSPADVAAAVAFLVSEEASYITGDVIHVSGGFFGCL